MRSSKRPQTVLIVEDAALNRKLTAKLLTLMGYNVLQAENGQQALEQIDRHSVDLVLLDLYMPVMDGWQCLRRIRSERKYEKLPILIVTSQTDSSVPPTAKAMGATEVLQKSGTSVDALLDRVQHYAPLTSPALGIDAEPKIEYSPLRR